MLMQKTVKMNFCTSYSGVWYDIVEIENSLTAGKTNSLPKEIVHSLNKIVFILRVAVLS